LREDPNECPGKLESIERRDMLMATDYKELCRVKYIYSNVHYGSSMMSQGETP
jgi:hypothetical protein